jgi:hypothetical protein
MELQAAYARRMTAPPPDPGTPATLAHVLAVQGVSRATLVAMIQAGLLTRSRVADLLAERAFEMRSMTDDPAWHRAAATLDTWADEIRHLGNFGK